MPISPEKKIARITAFWAFSEAILGGILHFFKIPLTGLIIGGFAIVCVYLISRLTVNPRSILKSGLIVIIVKGVISPYTPLTAYLALAIQILLGYIFFYGKNYYIVKLIAFALLTQLYSAMQKLFVLTVLFGTTFWEAVDLFIRYISNIFFISLNPNLNISYYLIGLYILLHFIGGIFFVYVALKIESRIAFMPEALKDFVYTYRRYLDSNPKKKNRFKKITFIAVWMMLLSLLILSYIYDNELKDFRLDLIIMIVRYITILFVWYSFVGPFLRKILNRKLKEKGKGLTSEVDEAMNLIPLIREILFYLWKKSSQLNRLNRVKYVLINTFLGFIYFEFE